MVDALLAARRALGPSGLVIDLRPDARRAPRVLSRGRVVGRLVTRDEAAGDDATADAAVEKVVAGGHYRDLAAGHLWYRVRFANLAELDGYVSTSPRFGCLSPGTRERLRRREAIVVRRAIQYRILERSGRSSTAAGARTSRPTPSARPRHAG